MYETSDIREYTELFGMGSRSASRSPSTPSPNFRDYFPIASRMRKVINDFVLFWDIVIVLQFAPRLVHDVLKIFLSHPMQRRDDCTQKSQISPLLRRNAIFRHVPEQVY